jgi:flavin reductase (DIM6/NTAB) family NADH-FMN oxidoreductase RutF
MEIDPSGLSTPELYKVLTGSILPRPIAWVSTLDPAGQANLAPFSFFTVASVNPPVLCFAPLLDDNRAEKHTLANIRQTGEFVVNIVSCDLVEPMNQTSAPYPPGVSEFSHAGVTPQASTLVRAPCVREALIKFECTLQQIIGFGSGPMAGNLVLGQVCRIHLHPDLYRNGRVDGQLLDCVGRLAGNYYTTTRDRFELARPRLKEETS